MKSNRVEPNVNVGIIHGNIINFVIDGNYVLKSHKYKAESECVIQESSVVNGSYSVQYMDGFILYNGEKFSSLAFVPIVESGVEGKTSLFWLKEVTIGIDFHWERKENQCFEGILKFIVEEEGLTAINILGVEEYLKSVISSEMSATASEELLKAHAVISRSWLLAQIEKNKSIKESKENYCQCVENNRERIKWYDREDHVNFDVCADDHCQRYQGLTRATTPQVSDAIDATFGEVLMSDNKICDARFSKCCGGVFEEYEFCWEDKKYPYLVKRRDSVNEQDFPDLTVEREAERWIMSSPDAFCNTTDVKVLNQVLNNYDQETKNFYRWRVEYGVEELSLLAKERSGIDFGTINEIVPIERGTSGRISKLKISGTKREMYIGKELEIRKTLSKSHLFSSAFVVKKEGDKFVFYGAGWGHGVGLCQIGAAVMGEKGYKYKDILLHYYVGAKICKKY